MPHSLDAIFRPRAVAVVGASRRADSIGGSIVARLFAAGFNGPVFPVNPHADVVHSTKSWPSVSAIPDAVDMAVIAVPAAHVLAAARDCVAKGVRGLVVITAGFSEAGAAGAAVQAELRDLCRAHGVRLIGPNCMGVINAEPEFRLDATFAPVGADAGTVAFASQSGAMGVAILNACRRLGIGFTQFVSMGNKADVSGNDLLEYWEDDPRTQVIGLYLESLGNPQKFQEIARRVTRKKPVLMVKSGRTGAGARAASSHTGALATGEAAVAALVEQTGVIRCDTLEELFDIAAALTRCPLPGGKRVAFVSNAGGPAIMAADAAEACGLETPVLAAATQAALRAFLPATASVQNPVDMIASASAENYVRSLEVVAADPGVDAVVVISVPPILFDPTDLMRRITAVAVKLTKPVLTVFMAPEPFYESVHDIAAHPPVYRFPENALRALHSMDRYAGWKRSPVDVVVPRGGVDSARARALVGRAQGWLAPVDVRALLQAYGVPLVAEATCAPDGDVAAAAGAVGFPCVLKATGPELLHKSDVGGVALNLADADAVMAARAAMLARLLGAGLGNAVQAFVVQRQVGTGREVLIGATRDAQFGALVGFGLGGRYVEALRDVAFRLAPLTPADARALVRGIRGWRILAGVRGEAPVDEAVLVDVILAVSALMTDHPSVAEIDLNPVVAQPVGVPTVVVDARVRVEG